MESTKRVKRALILNEEMRLFHKVYGKLEQLNMTFEIMYGYVKFSNGEMFYYIEYDTNITILDILRQVFDRKTDKKVNFLEEKIEIINYKKVE